MMLLVVGEEVEDHQEEVVEVLLQAVHMEPHQEMVVEMEEVKGAHLQVGPMMLLVVGEEVVGVEAPHLLVGHMEHLVVDHPEAEEVEDQGDHQEEAVVNQEEVEVLLPVGHMEHHLEMVEEMGDMMVDLQVGEMVEVSVDIKEELGEEGLAEDLADPVIGRKLEEQMVGVLSQSKIVHHLIRSKLEAEMVGVLFHN